MAASWNYALTKNEVITEMVSCDICCEKFKKTLDMVPKMLVCLHTFCAACLKRLVKNWTISCPTCRKKTTLGTGGVDGLGSNYRISRLSDVVEEAADFSEMNKRSRRGGGEKKVQKESSPSLPSTMLKSVGNENCVKHPEEQMKIYCRGCSEILCCFCAIMEHNGHNLISLNEAVEEERVDLSDLCVEASSIEDKIEVELRKLEQKRIENVDRSHALHLKIDQEADELISRINVCRQKAHEDVDAKISSRQRELDEHRLAFEALMSLSEVSRAKLQRALEEASNAPIFGSTCGEAKKLLISVVEKDVNKVDGMFEEEVMVSVVIEALDLGKTNAMFEIRTCTVGGLDKSVVLLSIEAGIIGLGVVGTVWGSTDVLIPAGGSVEDALLFVPDFYPGIKVFNLSSGALVREIVGDTHSHYKDLLIVKTGPQSISEQYVCDAGTNRIVVLDPMTGDHIRSIGRGIEAVSCY